MRKAEPEPSVAVGDHLNLCRASGKGKGRKPYVTLPTGLRICVAEGQADFWATLGIPLAPGTDFQV